MSTVVPPLPTPPQQPLALPRVAILAAPQALLDLTLGSKLDVVVTQVLNRGHIKLSSPLGDITLGLPGTTAPKIGTPFVLQLLGLGAQPKAQLIVPGGQTTGPATQYPAPSGLVPGAPGASMQTSPVQPALHIGALVTAGLVRPLTVNAALVIVTPSATGRTQVPGAIPAGNPSSQAPGTIAPGGNQPGGTPAGTSVPNPHGANPAGQPTATPGAANQTFPAGSGLTLKIVSVQPPATNPPLLTPMPASGPVSVAPGATLEGIVSGRQGIGNTVVQTHAGPITLPTAQPLAPGTSVIFEIRSLVPQPPAPAQHPVDHLHTGTWPALDDALETLREISPAAHMQVLHAAIPRADAQLATNVLFFLSALRGGDLKGWLGDGPQRILERQRPELLGRLKDDLGHMSRRIHDPDTGDWRIQGVPFFQNDDIEQFRLLIRDHDGENENEGSENRHGTRFVIDLNLSHLGHMQIDGLVGEKGKRLDLVLRSDGPLDATMRRDLHAIYANALEVTGIDGSIGFQAAPAKFIEIPAGPSGAPRGGVVI